jgi:peptidoglycan/LPS O-acetylase OafA/YrhL
MKRSFGEILRENGDQGPGFDILRIGLASVIVFAHCLAIAGGPKAEPILLLDQSGAISISLPHGTAQSLWAILHQIRLLATLNSSEPHFIDLLVPMFFALSGFLVTGSAFRTRSLSKFLSFRVLRILPALFVEVVLSAIVLGPALTTFSLKDYFSDPLFWRYFGNIVGHIQFTLPGLFYDNPLQSVVNGNVWTLPPEFYCYLLTAAMIITGLLFNRAFFTVVFFIGTGIVLSLNPAMRDTSNPVYLFFCGSLLYHWRDHVRISGPIVLLSLAIIYWQMITKSAFYVFPIFVSYITVCLGISWLPRLKTLNGRDYSYGIYLYGFPITQAIIALVSPLRGHGILLFLVAGPITLAFAMFSWHWIEKPALSLKRFIAEGASIKTLSAVTQATEQT